MPSRIATGPTEGSDSIRVLVRSDASVIEAGLRLFDFDFRTGPDTCLDAIGSDSTGRLALIAVAADDPGAALARLLDGHLWVRDQRDLLSRLYADRGARLELPPRGILLAPSFTHAFLRRLSLLSVEIDPFLARDVGGAAGAARTIIESATRIFGLQPREQDVPATMTRSGSQPFWPDGILPSDDAPSARDGGDAFGAARFIGADAPGEAPAGEEETPWPDAPEERFPWDLEGDAPRDPPVDPEFADTNDGTAPDPVIQPHLDEPAAPAAFEPLTAEEMDEFESFERHRRDRRGRA